MLDDVGVCICTKTERSTVRFWNGILDIAIDKANTFNNAECRFEIYGCLCCYCFTAAA